MKNLMNPLMIAGAIILMQGYPSVQAQDMDTTIKIESADRVVRQDKVKFDLTTPADKNDKEVYHRTVTLGDNGYYNVVVKDDNDQVRMTGSYLDEELQTADGQFTFYYANGAMESTGAYANGVKTGTWERYAEDGTPKAERNYTGLTWEDMAVELGVAANSGTN